MDNDKPEVLIHFGVPGMKWGIRRQRRIDKIDKKIETLKEAGNDKAAARKTNLVNILKKRQPMNEEIAVIGERIRRGTNFAEKLIGRDNRLMVKAISKGSVTNGERKFRAVYEFVRWSPLPIDSYLTMRKEVQGLQKYGTPGQWNKHIKGE